MIRAAWFTMNPNLGASARALQDWVLLEKHASLSICVVLQKDGDLRKWLQETGVTHIQDPMYWPDRQKFLLSALHAMKLKRWITKHRIQLLHCYEHDLYPFAVALRWVTSLPLLCHIHYAPSRGFASWAFGPRKRPDGIIWTSAQQRDDCAEVMAGLVPTDKQHLIPLGIDVNRFGSHVEQRAEYFVGRWTFEYLGAEYPPLSTGTRTGTATFTSDGGHFVTGRIDNDAGGRTYQDTLKIGLDPDTNMLVFVERRSDGFELASLGNWRSPIAITFLTSPVRAEGKTFQLRRVLSVTSNTAFEITEEISVDGSAFKRLGKARYTRTQ